MNGEEKSYGGCEGPDAMYVKLISSDGHEFVVKTERALTSGMIKAMLSGPGQFSRCSVCSVISSRISEPITPFLILTLHLPT
uniref:SKP1 component POZ domain-containing protein n=1 Tax=Piliocolobus tephrosceles TaxID=591936 RepID=A0A8C9I3D8_9PRIM